MSFPYSAEKFCKKLVVVLEMLAVEKMTVLQIEICYRDSTTTILGVLSTHISKSNAFWLLCL